MTGAEHWKRAEQLLAEAASESSRLIEPSQRLIQDEAWAAAFITSLATRAQAHALLAGVAMVLDMASDAPLPSQWEQLQQPDGPVIGAGNVGGGE